MAFVRMTRLTRKSNGNWYSRKVIPSDVREAYARAFEPRTAIFFNRPASTPREVVEAAFDDWKGEVNSRIARLRAAARGEGEPVLPPRQAHVLAGEWYNWFIAQHEPDPASPEQWDAYLDELEAISLKFQPRDEYSEALDEDAPRSPRHAKAIHDFLTVRASVPTFLYARGRGLGEGAMRLFLDVLEGEFIAAMNILRRRARRDYSRDPRPETFPTAGPDSGGGSDAHFRSGLTVWSTFELWRSGKKPKPATVIRWRVVYVSLKERFGDRDAASITANEAQAWANGLTTPERSAKVVLDTWVRAAKVAFAWAVKHKRLRANPFKEVVVEVPTAEPKLRERDFTDSEWRTILGATLQPPSPRMEPYNAAARRWVPWICAYTGCRPGEACQLRAEDIFEYSPGLWVMRITPEAGTVKSNEARRVPLHEHLLAQGFLAFVKAKQGGPLFYDPKARRKVDDDPNNPMQSQQVKARNKLAAWTRSLGISDKGVSPGHAWRHTFGQRALRAKLGLDNIYAICGWRPPDVAGKIYLKPPIEVLADDVKRFPRYDLDDPQPKAPVGSHI